MMANGLEIVFLLKLLSLGQARQSFLSTLFQIAKYDKIRDRGRFQISFHNRGEEKRLSLSQPKVFGYALMQLTARITTTASLNPRQISINRRNRL